MAAARVVVRVPAQAKRGEVIEIRTLAAHTMETGFRRTQLGELVPRDIIRSLVCTYNGVEVFRAELHPAIAANPLLVFTTVATESGTLELRWSGDNGYSATQSVAITVV
ncbi:MAG TPA: thiosulfate oxidation carrier complex protein SoxZ [Burkholderiales bacterium]